MKQSSLTIFFAAFMTALFSACSDDFGDMEISTEELYTRAFIKEFGIFDANHTWCAATPTSITINPQTLLNDVKVYSKTDGKYYYVAHYTDVYKSTTITFDAPRGTTDLKIVADGTTYYAQAGTTLTVTGGSRAIITDGTDVNFVVSDEGKVFEFDASRMVPLLKKGPWEVEYLGETKTGEYGFIPEGDTDNRDKDDIYLDFSFIGTGQPITIYPMYWCTNQVHTLGIYYFVNGQMVTVPVYEDKDYGEDCRIQKLVESEEAQYDSHYNLDPSDTSLDSWLKTIVTTLKANYESGTTDMDELLASVWSLITAHYTSENKVAWTSYTNWHSTYYSTYTSSLAYNNGKFDLVIVTSSNDYIANSTYEGAGADGTWSKRNNQSPYSWEYEGNRPYRSKGITITTPAGVEFGMYLDLDPQDYADPYGGTTPRRVYSQTSLLKNFSGERYECLIRESMNDEEWAAYLESDEWKEYITTTAFVRQTSYACSFTHPLSGNLYFSFEDAYEDRDYDDLNDLVFMIQGVTVEDMEYEGKVDETYTWLICAEDLGTTDDFDFNDMIIAVEAEGEGEGDAAYKKLTLKAMAAGGTKPLKLYFDPDKLVDSKKNDCDIDVSTGCLHPTLKGTETASTYEEFHMWFDSGHSSSSMINTGSGADINGCKGRKCILYVDKDFTLDAKSVTVTNNKASLADFYIVVDNDATNQVIKPSTSTTETKAPQMFVVLDHWDVANGKYDGDTPLYDTVYYQWPVERSDIRSSYDGTKSPDPSVKKLSFENWVGDQDNYADWFKYPTGSVCRYN